MILHAVTLNIFKQHTVLEKITLQNLLANKIRARNSAQFYSLKLEEEKLNNQIQKFVLIMSYFNYGIYKYLSFIKPLSSM